MVEVNLINEYYDIYNSPIEQLNLFNEYNKTLLKELTKDIPLPIIIEYNNTGSKILYNLALKNENNDNYKYLPYCINIDIDKVKEVLSLIKDICDNNLDKFYKYPALSDIIGYYEYSLKSNIVNVLRYAKTINATDMILYSCEQYIINSIRDDKSRVGFGSKIRTANNKDNTILPKVARIMFNLIKPTITKELLTIN